MEGYMPNCSAGWRHVPQWICYAEWGYCKPGEAAVCRLHEVLEDSDLGLSSGGFDFRFGSREFLCALCDVVSLDEANDSPFIEARQ